MGVFTVVSKPTIGLRNQNSTKNRASTLNKSTVIILIAPITLRLELPIKNLATSQ